MAAAEINNMAVFCDFENVALGVADAKYDKFSIKTVLEKLLVKGTSWSRRPTATGSATELQGRHARAAFELIEIPHVRQSGKNSADIRMVVDALDSATRRRTSTPSFASAATRTSRRWCPAAREQQAGDRRRREGLDLRPADQNCDEFIFYDDLVRVAEAKKSARRSRRAGPCRRRRPSLPTASRRRRGEEGEDAAGRKKAQPAAGNAAPAPAESPATTAPSTAARPRSTWCGRPSRS